MWWPAPCREGTSSGPRRARATAAGSPRVAPADDLNERVLGLWLVIALLALGGVGAALGLGLVQSRRFARPLERLADTAAPDGTGRLQRSRRAPCHARDRRAGRGARPQRRAHRHPRGAGARLLGQRLAPAAHAAHRPPPAAGGARRRARRRRARGGRRRAGAGRPAGADGRRSARPRPQRAGGRGRARRRQRLRARLRRRVAPELRRVGPSSGGARRTTGSRPAPRPARCSRRWTSCSRTPCATATAR